MTVSKKCSWVHLCVISECHSAWFLSPSGLKVMVILRNHLCLIHPNSWPTFIFHPFLWHFEESHFLSAVMQRILHHHRHRICHVMSSDNPNPLFAACQSLVSESSTSSVSGCCNVGCAFDETGLPETAQNRWLCDSPWSCNISATIKEWNAHHGFVIATQRLNDSLENAPRVFVLQVLYDPLI